MKIDHIELSEELTEKEGIQPIKLERLGSVIALVGKNGSGKSRILRIVEEYLRNLTYSSIQMGEVVNLPDQIEKIIDPKENEALITKLSVERNVLRVKLKATPSDKQLIEKIADLKQEINNLRQTIVNLQPKSVSIISKYIIKIQHFEIRNLQAAIENVSEETIITFEKLIDSIVSQEEYNELNAMYSTGLTYLAKLPHQLIDDFIECFGDDKKFKQKSSYKRFSSLSTFINLFLKKDLTWERKEIKRSVTTRGVTSESQGVWKLNSRLFDYNELSEGEKVLFAYSLLFFLLDQNKSLRIRESIIFIDEPELHLHPESEVDVIAGVRRVIYEKGQLWIATHSISILSSLSYDEIFMIKNGSITSPRRTTPGDSFVELMGLETHIDKLSHFVTNIANWAFLNFMTQCFADPEVIKCAQKNDPEFLLFKESLQQKSKGFVLLDFGAGQGRMYSEIIKDQHIKDTLQYSALEPNDENFEELKKLQLPVYKDYNDLPDNHFDYILLCNVLHEINIQEWERTLNKIRDSLKDDGYLILIEDLVMPKGEKIGSTGFLIMDTESLKALFSTTSPPLQISSDSDKYTNRLLCSVISKISIGEINKGSIVSSLEILKENVLKKIKKLRTTPVVEENKLSLGRESAFYSQLYINVLLAIDSVSIQKLIHETGESEAEYPGGEIKWREYLQNSIDSEIPVKKGAAVGTYTVVVQFTVDANGVIREVAAMSNHGYGMEAEAVRVIKNGSKWKPAAQNGRKVNAYRKQPIVFRVTEANYKYSSEVSIM